MASSLAVAFAALMQIVLGISFFIEQNRDRCSTAPTLASWIFLIAFLDILLDICVYPVRYMHLPYICQIIVETIVTVLLTEFGTLMVWCTIEKICCKLSKYLLLLIGLKPHVYYEWEDYILGTSTTLTSVCILLFVAQATDHFHLLRKRSLRIYRKIYSFLIEYWCQFQAMLRPKSKCATEEFTPHTTECFDLDSEISFQPRPQQNRRRNRSRSNNRSRSRNRNRK